MTLSAVFARKFHFGDQFRLSVVVQVGKPLVEVISRRNMPHGAIIAYRLCPVNCFVRDAPQEIKRDASDFLKQPK